MAKRSEPTLAERTLLNGRGRTYWAEAAGRPLSLKCMANGRARYLVGRREFTVDDGGWLIVNEGQSYTIEIDSPTVVETFVFWFPHGWADEVWQSATEPTRRLLEEAAGARSAGQRCEFFERYTPNERSVAPLAHEVQAGFKTGAARDEAWLEERLRELLVRMLDAQGELRRAIARLPAIQAGTREELWRRLNRARDFAHAHCTVAPTLEEMARVAAMSPYHFLRNFRAAFRQTPHEWLTVCRMERAKFLLARTDLPVTEVCFAIGYESLGSFSAWFQRSAGKSPQAWRAGHGARRAIRNFREAAPAPELLSSRS